MAYAAILGGLLGAGGSIAGGIIGTEGSSTKVTAGNQIIDDPLAALLAQDTLLQLGYFDPTILQASSPLNQAAQSIVNLPQAPKQIKKFTSMVSTLSELFDPSSGVNARRQQVMAIGDAAYAGVPSQILKDLGFSGGLVTNEKGKVVTGQAAIKELGKAGILNKEEIYNIQKGQITLTHIPSVFSKLKKKGYIQLGDLVFTTEELEALTLGAGAIGMSPDQLVQSELTFQQNAAQTAETLGPLAQDIQANRQNLIQQFNALAANLPDTSAEAQLALQNQLKDQLLGNLTEAERVARNSLLQQANAGGYNPAAGLEELARLDTETRRDADLTALSQAISLIGGQQALAQTGMSLLQAGINPQPAQGAAQNLAAQRTGSNVQPQIVQGPQPNALTGQAIGAAGNTLGSAIAYAPILAQLRRDQTAPGAAGSLTIDDLRNLPSGTFAGL